MTAEQFWLEYWKDKTYPLVGDGDAIAFAEAYAAAQLAGSERIQKEMAESSLSQQKEAQRINAEWVKRAMAAEQRLQEAQALSKRQMEAQLAMAESLRQREAELEQRWIAVGERLPDEPQHDVLLWIADDWESGKNFQQVGVIGEFNRDEWDGKVTHWQPLPSPPKEAK